MTDLVDRVELRLERGLCAGLGEGLGVAGDGPSQVPGRLPEGLGRRDAGDVRSELVFGVGGHASGEMAEQADVPGGGEQAASITGDAVVAHVGDDGIHGFVRLHVFQVGGLVGVNGRLRGRVEWEERRAD
ncbi:hypothetical protein [Streptomyces cellulosae]|uniref:hypothetical protein n=1 Tax=Streptomyces cellulosae TaxID=1968 RepID=UPI00131B401D|nr:hypothetical protein [Streptomyces cellulosae]